VVALPNEQTDVFLRAQRTVRETSAVSSQLAMPLFTASWKPTPRKNRTVVSRTVLTRSSTAPYRPGRRQRRVSSSQPGASPGRSCRRGSVCTTAANRSPTASTARKTTGGCRWRCNHVRQTRVSNAAPRRR
jgi:hypothetical protein